MADEDIALPFVAAFHGTIGRWQSEVSSQSMDELCGQDPPPAVSGVAGPPLVPCPKGCPGTNGDPHLTTLNARRYDFQGAGEFTLLRSPDASLEIQGRQEPWKDSNKVSLNTAIAARVGGHTIGVYSTPDGFQVLVDGTVTDATTPIDLGSGGRLAAYAAGYEIDFPDGTKLWTLSIRGWGINALN